MKRNLFLILICCWVFTACHAQTVQRVKITDLEAIIRSSNRPMVINMWATWCVPCIEELPYFQEETARYGDSVELLLVSLDFKEDFPSKIETFRSRRKISARTVWLDETDADYFCPKIDSAWSGAIPATLFVNPKKGYRHFIGEQLSREQLRNELMAMLR